MIEYRIVWTDQDSVIVAVSELSASNLFDATRWLPSKLLGLTDTERLKSIAVDLQPDSVMPPRPHRIR